jgi:hypothetical protein
MFTESKKYTCLGGENAVIYISQVTISLSIINSYKADRSKVFYLTYKMSLCISSFLCCLPISLSFFLSVLQ